MDIQQSPQDSYCYDFGILALAFWGKQIQEFLYTPITTTYVVMGGCWQLAEFTMISLSPPPQNRFTAAEKIIW
jgi:hypothetical protein